MKKIELGLAIMAVIFMTWLFLQIINPDPIEIPDPPDPETVSMFQSGVYYDDMVDKRYAMQIAMIDGSTIAIDSIWNIDDSAYYFIEHGTWKDRKVYFHECYGILFIYKQKE